MKWIFLLVAIFASPAHAQLQGSRYFIGSSAFTLVNLIPDLNEPPNFYQLNLGYQLSPKDTVSIEIKTWRYYAPLGITNQARVPTSDKFPGYVSSVGIGMAYQRFLLRKLYTAIHVSYFKQDYRNPDNSTLDNGHQIFMTFRLGYHISLFSDRFFLEPSLAMTYWPIENGMPASFKAQEDRWKKFNFEPGLHIGWVF